MSLKKLFAVGSLVISLLLGASISADEINLYFETAPLPERLRPFSEPASLSLLATAADGTPLAGGWVNIRLEAPQSGGFFSTDFPLVEGTELVEMRIPLKAGKAEWKYLFPIRGEYRLDVEVVTAAGTKISKTFEFRIREHGTKWLILGSFTLGLFGVGFVAGRIFTPPARHSKGAVHAILLLVVIASFILPGRWAMAQAAEDDRRLARLDIDAPTVGKPARIHWRLDANGASAKRSAVLSLAITHVEKGLTVFAVDRIPVEGEYAMSFHFTDGAEYRVTANAKTPDGKSPHAEQVVAVTGVEPPLSAMMPAIGSFLAAIAAGLGVGRWSRRRRPHHDLLN
ncbi:MAG: hypothetical protein WD688_01935 [Candidatus Binatia bacterium]